MSKVGAFRTVSAFTATSIPAWMVGWSAGMLIMVADSRLGNKNNKNINFFLTFFPMLSGCLLIIMHKEF